jgi:hypothetical protein
LAEGLGWALRPIRSNLDSPYRAVNLNRANVFGG